MQFSSVLQHHHLLVLLYFLPPEMDLGNPETEIVAFYHSWVGQV